MEDRVYFEYSPFFLETFECANDDERRTLQRFCCNNCTTRVCAYRPMQCECGRTLLCFYCYSMITSQQTEPAVVYCDACHASEKRDFTRSHKIAFVLKDIKYRCSETVYVPPHQAEADGPPTTTKCTETVRTGDCMTHLRGHKLAAIQSMQQNKKRRMQQSKAPRKRHETIPATATTATAPLSFMDTDEPRAPTRQTVIDSPPRFPVPSSGQHRYIRFNDDSGDGVDDMDNDSTDSDEHTPIVIQTGSQYSGGTILPPRDPLFAVPVPNEDDVPPVTELYDARHATDGWAREPPTTGTVTIEPPRTLPRVQIGPIVEELLRETRRYVSAVNDVATDDAPVDSANIETHRD